MKLQPAGSKCQAGGTSIGVADTRRFVCPALVARGKLARLAVAPGAGVRRPVRQPAGPKLQAGGTPTRVADT